MKRFAIALALVVAVASGALAQDFIFTTWNTWKDYPTAPAPCQLLGPAQPVAYDTSVWLVFTCLDGSVTVRRFFHPADQLRAVTPTEMSVEMPSYDATDKNWNGTGMTEAQWRARYPVR